MNVLTDRLNNSIGINKSFQEGQRKNIILVGLIFDSNLGDPAIYQATKVMVESTLLRNKQDYEIKSIDLYGRKKIDYFKKKNILKRIKEKVKRKIFRIDQIDKLYKQVTELCEKSFDKNTAGVIFTGGGLLKYNHQIISEPMQIILQYAKR